MNWWEYWIGHCWMTGWQSIRGAFRIWCDLMTDNFSDYTLLHTDDPFDECYQWFWVSLGEDNVYPQEFLEGLLDMCDRIDRGEEELLVYKTIDELMDEFKEIVADEQE